MFLHSRATNMADEGVDLLGIASYLGHADFSTAKVYISAGKDVSKRAYDKATVELE